MLQRPADTVIMIVDDVVVNLNLLSKLLKDQGYHVRAFPRGKLALHAARNDPPDLILLDVNMPEMNGYEVCEWLKSDERTQDIPVIFISALSDMLDKLRAFRCGGVDYITKPFQFEEVHARVQTHLTIRHLQKQLEHQNQHLEELVHQRTQQLAEARNRLAILDEAKTEFLNLISHELRTPLTGVFGIADMLFEEQSEDPEKQRLWNAFDSARRNLRAILDDALLLTRIDVSANSADLQPTPLGEIFKSAAEAAAATAKSRGIELAELPTVNVDVLGHPPLLIRAFTAILETAIKFAMAPHPVRVSVASVDGQVEIEIEATGRTIPGEFLDSFFDVFAVTRTIFPGGNLGLGPPVAKRIITLIGGSLRVENRQSAGILFSICLAAAPAKQRPS